MRLRNTLGQSVQRSSEEKNREIEITSKKKHSKQQRVKCTPDSYQLHDSFHNSPLFLLLKLQQLLCCVWMWSIQRLCFESWTEPTQTNTIRSFLLCFYEQRTSSVAACFIWALPEFQYVIGNNNNIILLPLYFMPIESPHTYQTRSHITTTQHTGVY